MACGTKSCKKGAKGKKKEIGGAIVAIITPFRDGKLDEEALTDLVEWHIKSGTHCIVPCGTTGESATLSHEEHMRVVELTIETVKGRVPVIAGTGSNSTEETIMLTHHAKKAGADAALVITPYYNNQVRRDFSSTLKPWPRSASFPWFFTMCRAGPV